MRIMFVAGFFSPVLDQLKAQKGHEFEERSVIWIPQYANKQINLTQFKSDFNDQVAQGATDILVCFFSHRGDQYIIDSLTGIADVAKSKRPDLDVKFKHYPNARETKGLVTKIEEFAPTRETQFSGSLQEIEAWVATQHNARIVLHPRAVRGLKKSAFQEVGLVYAALQLLAREYWHMRTATPQQAAANARAFNDKLANLGLELSPTISSSRAGEQGDEYFVKFPVGSDKKELLDLHLKKGVAHDERLCLRIYFFWYAPGQIIVIGWLTGHLDTRAS